MIPEVIVASLVVGRITGGNFWQLGELRIRHWWLIYAAVLLYVVALILTLTPVMASSTMPFRVMFILSRTVLLVLAVLNLTIPGVTLILTGMLLNLLPIVANGGQMPVAESAVKAAFGASFDFSAMPHVQSALATASTRLCFLSDIIPFRRPYVLVPGVYSIGDLIMSAGLFVAIVSAMRGQTVNKDGTH